MSTIFTAILIPCLDNVNASLSNSILMKLSWDIQIYLRIIPVRPDSDAAPLMC